MGYITSTAARENQEVQAGDALLRRADFGVARRRVDNIGGIQRLRTGAQEEGAAAARLEGRRELEGEAEGGVAEDA